MSSSRRLSEDLATLWLQSPLVIGLRLQQMGMAAMTGGAVDAVELNRMVTEKMMAATESALAANMAITRQMAAIALGGNPSSSRAVNAIAEAVIKPYSTRVRSNVRRLSK